MKTFNAIKFLDRKPQHIIRLLNGIDLYECPNDGDEVPLIAVMGDIAFHTTAYDVSTFEENLVNYLYNQFTTSS